MALLSTVIGRPTASLVGGGAQLDSRGPEIEVQEGVIGSSVGLWPRFVEGEEIGSVGVPLDTVDRGRGWSVTP